MADYTGPKDYKGFTYHQEILEDEDTRKILHYALILEGKPVPNGVISENGENSFVFDWSPYAVPSQKNWEMWIDLERPARLGNGPLNESALVIIKEHLQEFDQATKRDYHG